MKIKFINNTKPKVELVTLSGTNLSRATLCGADLSEANLSGADLSEANLSGADLSGATLCGADLSRATLLNCKMNWQSYELIARRIFNETPFRMYAGLILISKDWCWPQLEALLKNSPERDEILKYLKSIVTPNDNHPDILD